MGLGGQLANQAQQNQMTQAVNAANIMNANEAQSLSGFQIGGQLASLANQNDLAQLTAGANIGNQAQQTYLQALGLGGNLANQATQTGLQQYQDYLNQAAQAQQLEQARAQLGLSSSLALGGQQAGLSANMYDSANQAYANMIAAALGAKVNALQVQAQGNQNWQNLGLSLAAGA
jgi:hypothetical protein